MSAGHLPSFSPLQDPSPLPRKRSRQQCTILLSLFCTGHMNGTKPSPQRGGVGCQNTCLHLPGHYQLSSARARLSDMRFFLSSAMEDTVTPNAAQPQPASGTDLPKLEQDAIPVSFAQERLCFLEKLQPHSPLYNLPTVV